MSEATTVDRASVQQWLTACIADYTATDESAIEPGVPLATYGLDSVFAVTLMTDIEDRYDLVLEADTLWEHRTIDLLTELIVDRLTGAEQSDAR